MTEVSTFFETCYEAAALSQSAKVFLNAWQSRHEAIDEARNFVALFAGKFLEIQRHHQHWIMAEDIRPLNGPYLLYFHGRARKHGHSFRQGQYSPVPQS